MNTEGTWRHVEVLYTPADFVALSGRIPTGATCVVFDVLRATTTLLTALENGAKAVVPDATIAEAVAWRERMPEVLLAGERDGVRIRSEISGSVDFDLGNSPREFTAERVAGRTIVATTTNGTRALRACAGAEVVMPAALRNVGAVADWLGRHRKDTLLLVCSGTLEEAAYEDVLGAGALLDRLWADLNPASVRDGARMARLIYRGASGDLHRALAEHSRNGRRVLSMPGLAEDVAFCASEDVLDLVAVMDAGGWIRRLPPESLS
jgi:2-phosphosulfolactate phosphatase